MTVRTTASQRPAQTVSDYRRPVGLNCVAPANTDVRRGGGDNVRPAATLRGLYRLAVRRQASRSHRNKYHKTTIRVPDVTLNIALLTSPHAHKSHAEWSEQFLNHRRRRRGDRWAPPPKKKNREKIFFRQLLCRIRAFGGKNREKFGNFVNFSGKYHKRSGVLIIYRTRIM